MAKPAAQLFAERARRIKDAHELGCWIVRLSSSTSATFSPDGSSWRPCLLIADEPATSLDVAIQAQYLELLEDIQGEFGMSLKFITHDLGIVANMCGRVAVMYAGQIVESAPVRDIVYRPGHHYISALLKAVPKLQTKADRLTSISGQPPLLNRLPTGCGFAPRCSRAQEERLREEPPLGQWMRTTMSNAGITLLASFARSRLYSPLPLGDRAVANGGTLASSEEARGCGARNCSVMDPGRMSRYRGMPSITESVTPPASGTWASLGAWFTHGDSTQGGRSG